MAYSVRCAHLRTAKTMELTVCSERFGSSQCNSGPMMRDECWKDILSLDAPKIKTIHASTGSQYFRNERIFGTANGNKADNAEAMTKRNRICLFTPALAKPAPLC